MFSYLMPPAFSICSGCNWGFQCKIVGAHKQTENCGTPKKNIEKWNGERGTILIYPIFEKFSTILNLSGD